MIEDRLSYGLINKGYRRVDSNVNGIYLYYRAEIDTMRVISVVQAISGTELSREQYLHVIDQIKKGFDPSEPRELKLLSLIITQHPDQAKQLCVDLQEDIHWIADLWSNRLIIYETQMSSEFDELRTLLEQLLYEDTSYQTGAPYRASNEWYRASETDYQNSDEIYGASNPNNYRRGTHGRRANPYSSSRKNLLLFTLSNSALIVLNVLIFLLLHYTEAFGGQKEAVRGGALSWYFVKEEKEYYRLLTSMFLHSDWSHLINNMLVLLFVGDNLERAAGKLKYLVIYFGSGIIAGITSISYNMWKDYAVFSYEYSAFSIGASGAIFGVVGAMLLIVIVNRGRLEDISTRQMIMFIFFSLYGGILNSRIDQAAHIGGFLAGFVLAAIIYRRPKGKHTTGRVTAQE